LYTIDITAQEILHYYKKVTERKIYKIEKNHKAMPEDNNYTNMRDKFLALGNYTIEKLAIGGEFRVYETPLEDRFHIEGTLSYNGNTHNVKGIVMHDTIDKFVETTIILFQLPIKDNNTNTIYQFDAEFQLKPSEFKLYKKLNKLFLKGPYSGIMNNNATITVLDEELLEDFKDIPIKEFIFPEIDFDNMKNIPMKVTLENYPK
jgi:hypothetical protein